MEEKPEDRLNRLEKDVRELRLATTIKQTPAFGISIFASLVLYIALVSKLPLPGDPAFWPRLGIGFASAFCGLIVYHCALAFVTAVLKAIAEIAAVVLMLINVSVGVILCTFPHEIQQMLSQSGVEKDEQFFAAVLTVAIALFILDVFAFLVLYPLARTAGTSLELE